MLDLRPSFTCTSLKWTVLLSTAENSLTGTLTSPNETVPFQIERGAMPSGLPGFDICLYGHVSSRTWQGQQPPQTRSTRSPSPVGGDPRRPRGRRASRQRPRAAGSGSPSHRCPSTSGCSGKWERSTCANDGRQRLYRLNGHALKPIHDWVKAYEQTWSERFDALDVVLDDLKREEQEDGDRD